MKTSADILHVRSPQGIKFSLRLASIPNTAVNKHLQEVRFQEGGKASTPWMVRGSDSVLQSDYQLPGKEHDKNQSVWAAR